MKAQHGDEQAFTDLILMLKHDLYKIAKMRIVSNDDIDDAIQETMIEAFKNIKKLKKIESFKPWIIKILINKCNKIYQKKKMNEITFEEDIDNYLVHESEHLSENDMDFYLLIKCLNYEERIIVTLYYLECYTTKEISQILGINENTIKTKLARAKMKIKNNYKEESI
ncbi:MAG: sigma-70 family RNA polymerase sigma factor [Clostridia bacterium]|nr:sigma-70 family RNA polymerase sigma factor [Clostridia bacterium]